MMTIDLLIELMFGLDKGHSLLENRSEEEAEEKDKGLLTLC